MKSKMLKRAIAIMLCMVIVMGGAEHMRAGSSEGTEETTTETAEEEIVLSDDGDENPVADAEEEKPKAQTEETPSEEGQSGPKTEEGQSESKAEEGQSGPKVEEGQSGAQNPDAGETKTGEGEENIPEEELKEKPIMELTYEDSQVSIRVTADEEGNIPQGASLSVTPIEKQEIHDDMDADAKAEAEELNAQYDATAEKLQEKAEGEEYDILGFLAYDITFVDENGDKLEPNGSVSVSMDYKEAAIPEEVKTAREAGAEVADVTLMHLEENSDGEVKDVIDMVADENQEASVQTTANTEVEKAEFATESFSTFTLVWKATDNRSDSIKINCVTTDGKEIGTDRTLDLGTGMALAPIKVEEIESKKPLSSLGEYYYTFQKATLNSVNGTEVKWLKCDVTKSGVIFTSYTYTWKYSTDETGANWNKLDNKTLYFVYESYLVDLDGNKILPDDYTKLATAAEQAANYATNQDTKTLPITWKRSQTVIENGGSELSWKPGERIKEFGDSWYTDAADVWDGSRSKDGKNSTHQFTNYLPDNKITVKNGVMYDSASWTRNSGDNYYLFRGTFDLSQFTPEEGSDYGNYNFTIKSVVDENKIYINDNMFVFVYPEDVTIDESNWQEYLAFWTGTANQKGEVKFKDSVLGRKATRLKGEAKKGLPEITDGWYTEPVTDGAGNIIQHALSTGHKKQFRIDVITHDNAEGGGMYRLKLEAEKDPSKVTFRFRKVDSEDTSKGIGRTTFYLESTAENGANYYLTTNDEGYASAIVPTGTYTLRETKAHQYYQATSNEWTVTIGENNQVTMTAKNGNDNKATLGGSATDGWYITNTKRTDIKPALNAPQHNKTIYKNGTDDYTLSLDVKGAVGAADPIDVLLIVDESSSMNETRRNNVTNAINTLKANLQASEAKDNIRLAVVGFSGLKTGNYSGIGYYQDSPNNDAQVYKGTDGSEWSTVDTFSYTAKQKYGTNWQAGIKTGEKLLATRTDRKDAATYVVFLTDGEPTYYYDADGYTKGDGGDYDSTAYSKAVTEWTSSSYMNGATKYVVDATKNGANGTCKDFADAVGATKLSGANGTEMQETFKKIADSITKPKYDKVVITDTLSEYVDFQANPEVKVYAGDTELNSDQYTATISGKTITVNLLKGGDLQKDVVYKVTFKVKPTELAYKTYAESGYNAKGDKDTDTNPTKQITSSEKEGFHSNATAKVTYEVNGLDGFAEYKHPVVQVDLDTTNWSVEKKWVGGPEESVQVQLTAKYDAKNDDGSSTLTDVPDSYYALTGMRAEITLNQANEWKYTWNNLPQYYYYTAKDGAIAKTKIQYSVTEVNPSEKYTVTYEDKTAESKTVITNTVKYRWQIVKVSTSKGENGSVLTIPNAEFTLTDTKNSATTYTGTSGDDGVVTWTDSTGTAVERIPQGTYTLAETKAPNGYLLSDASWTVDTTGTEPAVTAGGTTIEVKKTTDDQGITTYSFQFENAPNYELPSTGGIGTYWYTIGGMLLMMAAALILYKKKKDTK